VHEDDQLSQHEATIKYAYETLTRLGENIKVLKSLDPEEKLDPEVRFNIMMSNMEGLMHSMYAILILALEKEAKVLKRIVTPPGTVGH